MARTVSVIKQEITSSFMGNSVIQEIYGFADGLTFENEFSKSSLENNLFDIFSFSIFMLEKIFDNHKSEIDTALYEQKSGTPRWYRNMALAFQYGFDLLTDSDKFDNTAATPEEIEASKIIKYCSVKESSESNRLTVKIAGESGDDLIPLTTGQKESFAEYMKEIKYAGVKLNIVNNPADKLVLYMTVYRDVLVLDQTGTSILNGDKPVEVAIRAYMKALPFDGELVINDLIEKLREVPGVINVNIINATSSYYDVVTTLFTNPVSIYVKTIPVAGYFEIENFDNVTYVV
jgi:hypothetical protein